MVSQLESPSRNLPSRPGVWQQSALPSIEGMVQVFTARQRGFFTSVMAQALRIAGQGTPALIIQFLKGGCNQGPQKPMQLSQHLDWVRLDASRCIDSPELSEDEATALQELWQFTRREVLSGAYDLVVLDELCLAIAYGLIPEAEVLELLALRPRHIDVILTGPEASSRLLDQADQITELRRGLRVTA